MAVGHVDLADVASQLEAAAAAVESLATENAILRSDLDAARAEAGDPESLRRIDAALARIRAVAAPPDVSPDASPSSPPSA